MKAALKRALGPGWRARARRLSGLRWVTKAGILRDSGVKLRRQPRQWLRYVLWDPEVESYSFELANEDELATFLADLLGVERERVAATLAEAASDEELTTRLSARLRRRFDAKTRQPLGNRLMWWALVRLLRPRLVVETGVYHGLGSLVLLRALERNAEEGDPGELLSVDMDPTTGWMVPPRLADRWRRVEGMTGDVLEDALRGHKVGLFLQETAHAYGNQRFEFSTVLAHRDGACALVDSGGGRTPALRELCDAHGGRWARFAERARGHWYDHAPGTAVAVFGQGATASASASIE